MAGAGAIEAGRAFVLVSVRDGLSPGFSAIKYRLQSFSREIDSYGQSIGRVAAVATGVLASGLAGLALPVKLAAGIESLRAEFTTLTGSVGVANKTLESLRKFANVTPFGTDGLARATALLLNFGIPAKQAVQDIRALGEISGGSQEKLNLLALAFAQVASKQRLMGQEALQLTEQGFNPLQEISRMTGETMLELSDRMSRGAISFDEVRAAVTNATTSGGRFAGMLDRMSKTVSGQYASLREELADVARSIGEQLLPTVREWISYARDVIKRIGDWVRDNKILAGGIAALASGLGVFTVAMWGVRAALGAVSTFSLLLAGGLAVLAKLFGSTSKKMNQTARQTKESALGVTSAIVTMSSTSDPLLMATRKLVSDLSLAFRRVGTVAKASMTKVETSVSTAAKSVILQVGEMVAAIEALNAALLTLPGASVPDVGDDEKKKKERKPKTKPEVGGMRGRGQFFAEAAAAAAAEKAIAGNLAKTSTTVQVANRELAAGLAGRAAMVEKSTTAITRSTQAAGLAGRGAMVTAATASTGLFARMTGALSAGLRVIGGLLTGTTLAVTALVVATTVAFVAVLKKIGYLEIGLIRVRNAFAGVSAAISTALGGVGRALAAGKWLLALQIGWQGLKLAALKAIEGLIGTSGNLLQQFGNFVIDFGVGIGQTFYDIVVGIGRLAVDAFWAAITGAGDTKKFAADVATLIGDVVAGSGSEIVRQYANESEKELNRLLGHLPAQKGNEKPKEDSQAEPTERKPTDAERISANRAKGVDPRASLLPDATIADANASAEERLKSLRAEIDELKVGAASYDQNRLALEGVTLANRKSIAALEATKLAVEAVNSTREKIKGLQEEILGLRFSTEAVERYKLAQAGVDKVLLARLASLQAEKIALESMKGFKDQATEALLGAAAAEKLRLAQQGLTGQQIKSITTMSDLAKRMTEARALADDLKERYKTPLQAFQESAAKIRDAQLSGMISQEVAARAYADAMQEMQGKTDELNAKANEGPKFASTFEQRRDLFAGVEQQARQARAIAEGQQQAAINARDAARLALGNKNSQLSQAEQLQLGLMREQNEFLSEMNKNLAKPKVVVSIP